MKRLCPCALVLLAATAGALSGQTVTGRVVAGESAAPLGGVFVSLSDGSGDRVGASLSRVDGTFVIRAQGAGEYVLRAEMIGYRSVSERVQLRADDSVFRTLSLPLQAIDLDAIVATASTERECRIRTADGRQLAALWDLARQALVIADWTTRSGAVQADGHTYQRLLHLADLEVMAETATPVRHAPANAFQAVDPALVHERGFVQREADGSATYYGADAALLLSDEFLDTHCFSIRRGEADHLLGLAFEPSGRRDVADIEGVLWVDRDTGVLTSLEYRFTRYPVSVPLPASRYGGRTAFRHLPGGGVAVESWWLRMPSLLHDADLVELRRATRCGSMACDNPATLRQLARAGLAIEEEGGEVHRFRLSDGTVLPAVDRATIAGVVLDSTGGPHPTPLTGAEVYVGGTARRATTDARGRFRLDNLAAGTYRIGVRHPRLAELGIRESVERVVEARVGDVTHSELALPGRATLAIRRCQTDAPESAAPPRLIFGEVRDAHTTAAIPGASVRLYRPGPSRDLAPEAIAETTSDPDGQFVFCDAPAGAVRLEAEFLGLGKQVAVVAAGTDRAPARVDLALVLSRAGRILGRVLEATTDSPVSGAVVRVADTGLRTVTGADGRFAFDSVPPGAVTLVTEHLAFSPSGGAVSLRGGERVEVELRVAHQVLDLEPIHVVARSSPLLTPDRMGGFYTRQSRGLGTFLVPADFEGRTQSRVTDLLRDAGGIRLRSTALGPILHGRAGGTLKDGSNPYCSPRVYLDGVLISTRNEELDDVLEITRMINNIPLSEVSGIEIYAGAASIPGEFQGLNTTCGVLAIWTKVRDHSGR